MIYTKDQILKIKNNCELFDKQQLQDMYDIMLDNAHDDFIIFGVVANASFVLRRINEEAYNCGFAVWCCDRFIEIDSSWWRKSGVDNCLNEEIEEEED